MQSNLSIVANVMQIVMGISLICLSVIVYYHQKKNDKEALRHRAWDAQQQLNFMILSNNHIWRGSDLIIDGHTGSSPLTIEDVQGAVFISFIQINRIHSLWCGWQSGILKRHELLEELRPTLAIQLGIPEIFDYCLTRGYSESFVKFMIEEMKYVKENLPQPESTFVWATNYLKAQTKEPKFT
ncbi:MAG: hypothetical protein COB54_06440 [Alphaproteobacteria bacterium]|nr:MAG: hypothetical protein COB54_06440 [Alphaproteobacteria bacterium]